MMAMGYPIEISEQVARLLGPENTRLVRHPADDGYDCVICGTAGQVTEPCSVVAFRAHEPDSIITRYAHASCSPSMVSSLDPRKMYASAAVLGHPRKYPLVITESAFRSAHKIQVGDRVDAVISRLLALGLGLVSDLDTPTPPASAGWRIQVTGPDTIRIDSPDGNMLYEGQIKQPAAWREAITANGDTAVLVTGTIGFTAAIAAGGQDGAIAALWDAARNGLLVGGTIPVSYAPRP
jgi:hypothetical protein